MTTNPYQPSEISDARVLVSGHPAPRERHWILRIKSWAMVAVLFAFIVLIGILGGTVSFLFKA